MTLRNPFPRVLLALRRRLNEPDVGSNLLVGVRNAADSVQHELNRMALELELWDREIQEIQRKLHDDNVASVLASQEAEDGRQ